LSGFGHPAVIDGQGGTGSAGAIPGERHDPGPAWLPLVPAAVTLLAGLYKITGSSYTHDETATVAAVHRSFPQLVRMLGNVDVVHGAYYALIWLVVRVGGGSELAVRLPSAVAMAVAAGLVAVLGRRLVSSWAGLAAGLAFAVLPSVSWYAQNAREGALLVALATLASYCFLRALEANGAAWRWLTGYGAALAALGLANLFGLLLVVAHAVTLGWSRRDYRLDRRFILGWLAAVAAAVIVGSPVAVEGYGQLHQIHWIRPPRLADLLSVQGLVGRMPLFLLTLAIIACAVAVSVVPRGGPRRPGHWPAGLLRLCLPWLLLPPAILLTASLAHPVYTFRYIVFCIPAAALLLGAALTALGRYAGPVALVLIVLIGLHYQLAQRRPDGHGMNIRAVDNVVARHENPGDALLNVSARGGLRRTTGEHTLEAAYPYGLDRLRDISTGVSPEQSGTLGGTYASTPLIRQRLAQVSRLWVVEWRPRPVPVLQGFGFRLVHTWKMNGLLLRLYSRRGHPQL
jgi:mannosyltransferase